MVGTGEGGPEPPAGGLNGLPWEQEGEGPARNSAGTLRELRFGDGDLRVGAGEGDRERGLGGERWGGRRDTESRANTALGGPLPGGKERRAEWSAFTADGLWPPSGARGAARVRGFADPEPAEGSHGCALQDRRAHPSLSRF